MSECRQDEQLNRIVTILYVSIQITVALFISIVGAVHVKRCKDEEKIQTHTDIAINSDSYLSLLHSIINISFANVLCLICVIVREQYD